MVSTPLSALTLTVTGRSQLLLHRIHIADERPPAWWSDAEERGLPPGGVRFRNWVSGAIMAQAWARVLHGDWAYAFVEVEGLYVPPGLPEQPPTDVAIAEGLPPSIMAADPDELHKFGDRVLRDLTPPLRTELFALTSFPGIVGYFMQSAEIDSGSTYNTTVSPN